MKSPFTDLDLKFKHVDLRNDDLLRICLKYKLLYSEFLELKDNSYDELWFIYDEYKRGEIVSMSKKGNIELYSSFIDKMISFGVNKSTFDEYTFPIILEQDAILDKINAYGIEAITYEEKKFINDIKYIKKKYGSLYFGKKGLYAVLSDVAKDTDKRLINILKKADELSLPEKLNSTRRIKNSLKDINLANLKNDFTVESGLDTHLANLVFDAYLYGLE